MLWQERPGIREQGSGISERSAAEMEPVVSKEEEIVEYLRVRGASFFQDLHEGVGGGYPGETLEALWALVWKGMVTNDGLAALRAYCERRKATGARAKGASAGSGIPVAADYSADGAGALGVECGGV